jgi:hypothetical protein
MMGQASGMLRMGLKGLAELYFGLIELIQVTIIQPPGRSLFSLPAKAASTPG